jgi:small subunit ribosomal protein S17
MAKTLTGIVTSSVADKTIAVTVTSRETHPIYGKQYTVTRKYAAHDENNDANKGDKVIISESRPFSKTKAFKLDSIVEKSRGSIQLKDEEAEIIAPKTVKKVEEVADKSKTIDKAETK